MNEMIPVNYANDIPTVSGRELHARLGIGTAYKDWFPRMCEYGFSEGLDFSSILSESTGGRPSTDHRLSIPMAKEIAMIQRTDQGRMIRQYLIKTEEAWNTPEMVMARALRMAGNQISSLTASVTELNARIEADRPKVLFADAVDASEGTCLIGELAKMLKGNGVDIGQNRLFEQLRRDGYLIRRRGTDYNAPTQKSMEMGLFKVKETAITHSDGHVAINRTTKVTGKGQQYFINLYLGKPPRQPSHALCSTRIPH